MAPKANPAGKAAEQELEVTRVLDAPRDLVFKAWTESDRLTQWWGPNGFTTPFCRIDLRPGGVFHNCMRSPEGRDYWSIGVYREIVAPERIVFTDSFSDRKGKTVDPARYGMGREWPIETVITVTLEKHEDKTRLTVHQAVPESVAQRAGARQGWNESLDRLADYLARA